MEQDLILEVSCLPKTWLIDLDGTVLKHNGFNSKELLLPGVKDFFNNFIKEDDVVIFTTARSCSQKDETFNFLIKNNIKFNNIIFNLPTGERFLINDIKPSGLKTAFSVNVKRNQGLKFLKIKHNNNL